MTEEKKDAAPKPAAARKPYATPKLRVFGDVAALTRSIGNTTTNSDGGHGAMSKTH
jgi:hypothetical protein